MDRIESKIRINSDKKSIYESFINPDKIKNFWFTYSSDKWESNKVVSLGYDEIDLEPFEIFIITCKENEEIVFSWGETSYNERKVEIKLNKIFENETIVTVVESGFSDDNIELLIGSKGGWVFMLACLKAYLESGITNLKLGMFC